MSYIERIKYHLIDKDYGGSPVKLTLAEEQILERLCFCDTAIREHLTSARVIPLMVSRFGISERQAHSDYAATQEVFCSSIQKNKSYFIDVVLGMMQDTRLKALAADDLKTAAACEANMIKAIAAIVADDDVAKFESLQPVSISIGNFPTQINIGNEEGFEEKLNAILLAKTGRGLTADTLKKLQSKPFKLHGKDE